MRWSRAGRDSSNSRAAFVTRPDATGARGPDLIRSKVVAHDVNGNLIGEVIRDGRPDKGMPPLPLTSDQITAIAAFLHDRAHQALESAQVPEKYPLAKLLTGHAGSRASLFPGSGRVQSLPFSHRRPEGHRRQVRSPSPRKRKCFTRREIPSISTVTVVLPTGERVQGALLHLDEFTVALRDESGWYRSFPLDKVSIEVHDPLAAHRKLLDELTQQQFHDLFAYLETLK